MQLSSTAQRIIGVLIEKQLATPQGYPLSLLALRAAANQTTNREPITGYSEAEISAGLKDLTGQTLVKAEYARRSSTPRYAHLLDSHLEIGPESTALLSVLLLRGPQTVGELRQRTDRLHGFRGLAEVQEALGQLAGHHFGPLVEEVERMPGQKETRWRHLLGVGAAGRAPMDEGPSSEVGRSTAAVSVDEVDALRQQVSDLRGQVMALEDEVRRLARFVGA